MTSNERTRISCELLGDAYEVVVDTISSLHGISGYNDLHEITRGIINTRIRKLSDFKCKMDSFIDELDEDLNNERQDICSG